MPRADWRPTGRQVHTFPVIARRTLHRLVALAAALAIVAAQAAAASHACSRGIDGLPAPAIAAQPCAEHGGAAETMPGERGNANLCEVHCQDTAVSVAAAAIAPPPDAAIAIPAPPAASDGMHAPPPDAKGAAPPARSRFCRLQL